MKNKFAVTLLTLALCTAGAMAKDETFFGMGAELFQDPFNKKIIITHIIPNSPAEQAGIKAGYEIVSVDGEKTRKMNCLCEIVSKIRGDEGAPVKLVVKPSWWKWETVELKRGLITVQVPEENPSKEAYWRQIAPAEHAYGQSFPKEVSRKLSRTFRKNILPINNYWLERREKFEISYNTCMSYSKNNQENCFINLLNRESEITIADKRIFTFLQYIPKK